MVEFNGRETRPQVDGQETRPQVDGRQRRHAIDLTAPSEVQIDTGPPIVDDFEDTGLGEYGGDTSMFAVDGNAPVPNGSYSLKTDTGGSTGLIVSTSGLDNYLDQGETMAAQLHPVTGNDSRMGAVFFVQDYNNLYMLAVGVDLGDFQIFKRSGGGYSLLVKTNVSLSQGTEFRVEVTPQTDGTLVGELFDESAGTKLASISTTDTTYTDGGQGWRIASGGGGSVGDAYDFARLK